MRLYQVSRPADPVVSLADMKAHLRVDHSEEDTLIQALEQAAVQHLDGADGWLGRALLQQTWELRLEDFCDDEIRIPLPPLITVDSIQYYNGLGVLTTLPTTYYEVVGATSSQPACVALRHGYVWPVPDIREEAVIITFTAGYSINSSPAEGSVPMPIVQAIKLAVGHWYANRESVAIGVSVAELPMAFEALLAPFRVHYFA